MSCASWSAGLPISLLDPARKRARTSMRPIRLGRLHLPVAQRPYECGAYAFTTSRFRSASACGHAGPPASAWVGLGLGASSSSSPSVRRAWRKPRATNASTIRPRMKEAIEPTSMTEPMVEKP